MSRTTLQDIATRLEVSKSTVAQVLSGRADARISAAVRKKVLCAARKMAYRPNYAATALRTGNTCLIGMVTHSAEIITRPGFLQEACAGLMNAMGDTDWALVQLFDQPRAKLERLAGRGLLDGIIFISSCSGNETLDFLSGLNLPLIAVNRSVADQRVSFVTHEYEQAGRRAVRELVNAGHRNLALVAFDYGCNPNQNLIRGFHAELAALKAEGVTGQWFDVIAMEKPDALRRTAEEVLRRGPFDAYIVDMPELAAAVCRSAHAAKRPIGGKKELIVFSSLGPGETADVAWQTFMHQNDRMGQESFRIIREEINHPGIAKTGYCLPFKTLRT